MTELSLCTLHALYSGTAQQRKALIRKLVKELRVMRRDEIIPTYRVPALVRAPGHQVDSGLHNPNLLYYGSYLLEGPKVVLTERHAKVRRDGYRSTWPRKPKPGIADRTDNRSVDQKTPSD